MRKTEFIMAIFGSSRTLAGPKDGVAERRDAGLTAVRLLTMHNLTFMQRLMERLRSQIAS